MLQGAPKRQVPVHSSRDTFCLCLQTFLLQKFKLMVRLQGSQHKAHFLINKRNPFTQAPQKYTKVLSFEQFSWNVFTLVFSTIFPGFHMGQILFAFFFSPRGKRQCLER